MRCKFLTTLFVLAFAGTAFAGSPGAWTFAGQEPVPFSFAALDVATLDANTFVAATILQEPDMTMILALKSSDGGTTMDIALKGADIGTAALVTTTDFFDSTFGLIGGIDMLGGLKGGLWRSDNAGERGSWTTVDLGELMTFGSTIDFLEASTPTFGVALGSPNIVLVTYDAGATWEAMNPPVAGTDVMNDAACFLSEDVGYITTGYDSSGAKSADPTSPEEMLHRTKMLVSPEYRWMWNQTHPSREKAIILEGIHKTADGGATWEKLIDKMNWYAYRISMPTEQYGAVITNEYYGSHGDNAVRYTDDGGYTWTTATLPDTVPGVPVANYILGDIKMLDNDLGYCSVFYGAGSIPMGGAFLITTDGGKTWDWDASGNTGGGYMGHDINSEYGFAVGISIARAKYTGSAGTNTAPTADAGEDGETNVDVETTLDGSGSSDPESDTLSFSWVQTDGAPATMVAGYGEVGAFVPTAEGAVTFLLTVSDGEFSDQDEVTFNVGPAGGDDDTTGDDDDVSDDDTAGDDDADDDVNADDDDDSSTSGGCGC